MYWQGSKTEFKLSMKSYIYFLLALILLSVTTHTVHSQERSSTVEALNFVGCDDCPNIITLTRALAPADRTRTKIGVGEEVDLSLDDQSNPLNFNWDVTEGNGQIIIDQNTQTVFFRAGELAGSSIVTYTQSNSTCSKTATFTVLAPSSVEMDCPVVITDQLLFNVKYYPACGMTLTPYISPSDVSFNYIEVKEGNSPIKYFDDSSFFWTSSGFDDHVGGAWTGIVVDAVSPGLGSRVNALDAVQMGRSYSNIPNPPSALDRSGGIYTDIPMRYRVITSNPNGAGTPFSPVRQQIISQQNGTAVLAKGGFDYEFLNTNPSVNWGQEIFCQ